MGAKEFIPDTFKYKLVKIKSYPRQRSLGSTGYFQMDKKLKMNLVYTCVLSIYDL